MPPSATPPSPPHAACFVVDAHNAVFDAVDDVAAHRNGFADGLTDKLTPYVFLAISLLLCFCGYFAMRLIVALAAFAAGAVAVVRILDGGAGTAWIETGNLSSQQQQQTGNNDEPSVTCDTLTIATLASGAVSALVFVLLTRSITALAGAVAAAGVAFAAFSTCGPPCDADVDSWWPGAPRVFGRPLAPFWAVALVAFLAGGGVARWRHRELLATLAAVLGGFGVAVAIRAMAGGDPATRDATFPQWAVFVVSVGSAAAGIGVQWVVVKKRGCCASTKAQAAMRATRATTRAARHKKRLPTDEEHDDEP